MLRSRLACAIVAIALGTGCATRIPYDPYVVPKHEFAARIHTIALAPVSASIDLIPPGAKRERIETLILAHLASHGFATVAPAEVRAIRDELFARLGGVFDPVTGQADEAKADTVRLETLRELGARFHADAVLYPLVDVVPAKFSGARANWCGVQQEVFPPTDNYFAWVFAGSQASQAAGEIPASCLSATIEDSSGREIYQDFGGIEILDTFDGTSMTTRPKEELFTDAARLETAVTLAVGALPMQNAAAPSPP